MRRLTALKSVRRTRRSNTNTGTVGLTSTHIRRNFPNPPPVATDLIATRRFEAVVTADTPTFTVSVKSLIDTVVGGSALWDTVQIHRIDVFGDFTGTADTSAAPITATLHTTIAGLGDTPTAYNDGVGTFRRAHVGFIPNSLFRAAWLPAVTTEPLLTITSSGTSGTNGRAIVQFVAVLRSTAGAPTAVAGNVEGIVHHSSVSVACAVSHATR